MKTRPTPAFVKSSARWQNLVTVALACMVVFMTTNAQAADPLASWNDGPAKQAILEFVKATTTQGSPQFVQPEARIATFDQDGTLWVEHPMYTQVTYCFERVPALVREKPGLKNKEPFRTVLSGNREAMAKLSTNQLVEILAATLSGVSVEEFSAEAERWLNEAKDPRWKRPYTELTYQPMQELLRYLRDNQFKTYIVTGAARTSCVCKRRRRTVFRLNKWLVPWAAQSTAMTRTASPS